MVFMGIAVKRDCDEHRKRFSMWSLRQHELLCAKCLLKRDTSSVTSVVMIDDAIRAEAPMFVANYPSQLADTYQAMVELVQAIAADEDNGPVNADATWVKGVHSYLNETARLTATFKAVHNKEPVDSEAISRLTADVTNLLQAPKCPGHPSKSVEVWSDSDKRFLCTKCMMKKTDRSDCHLLEDFAKMRIESLKNLHKTCSELMITRGMVLMQMLTIEKEDLDKYVQDTRKKRVAGDVKAGTSSGDGNVTLESAEELSQQYAITIQLLKGAEQLLTTLQRTSNALEDKIINGEEVIEPAAPSTCDNEVPVNDVQSSAAPAALLSAPHVSVVTEVVASSANVSAATAPASATAGLLPIPTSVGGEDSRPPPDAAVVDAPHMADETSRALSDMLAQLLQEDTTAVDQSVDSVPAVAQTSAPVWDTFTSPALSIPASTPNPAAPASQPSTVKARTPPASHSGSKSVTVVSQQDIEQRPWAAMLRNLAQNNPSLVQEAPRVHTSANVAPASAPSAASNSAVPSGKMSIPKPRSQHS